MVNLAVEGLSDEAVVRRLCDMAGIPIGYVYGLKGKSRLDHNLPGYNNAAQFTPWIVVRDLDHDAPCAPSLVRKILSQPAPLMCLRIAVREIESWLLADREGIAQYLGISAALVPLSPDDLDEPKQTLVSLARRSRKRIIREEIVPAQGASNDVGTGYTLHISDFATQFWNPIAAAEISDSLRRCIMAVETLKARIS